MASKTLNTILSLQDKMSPKILQVSKKVKLLDKDTQRATQKMVNMANKFNTSVNSMVGKATKLTAVGASIAGAFSLKTGFGEAMNMEGFRTQLITATKSAKKAGEIMKWSVNLANKTPFETGSIVEMSAKYEAMGLSAKKWGNITADMAGSTNKDVIQATEAIIDAQAGEMERLKEFGIKKADIAQKANEMFKNQQVINNKGQIVDQKKFNEALMGLMEDRYKGGAAALAKTTKGMWSTITGVTKTSLSNIMGMQNNGIIKSGSMLAKLKAKIQILADKLTQWQNDGTLDRIGKKFTNVFTLIYNAVSKAFNFIRKYQDIILFFLTFTATIMAVSKAVLFLKGAFDLLKFASLATKGVFTIPQVAIFIAAIAAAVAIGVFLWKNWDKIKEKAGALWQKLKEIFGKIKNLFKHPIKGVIDLGIKGDKKLTEKGTKGLGNRRTGNYGKNALGTSYWKGGLSLVGEHGPELVNMPSGSKVTTAGKSQQLINKSRNINVPINLIVQGNMVGNEEFASYMGDILTRKLKLALANM